MENHLPSFPTPRNNALSSDDVKPTISPHNLPICEPLRFIQFPTPFPLQGSIESVNSLPNVIFRDEERRFLDAWTTKVARSKRRLARQRSLSSSRASSLSAFGCNEDSKGLIISGSDAQNSRSRNLYTLCTPDKKILRFLLKKELKNSDVGSLGRIVLPKREAEENLPMLSDKEGALVEIRDVNSDRRWAMKYKYWANNRSRMYVLENTGDFVRQNGLVIGDSMTLYEDECKNLYVAVKKAENTVSENSGIDETETKNEDDSSATYTNMEVKVDEEETSLAILIEELKQKAEDEETSSNVMVSGNSDSCYGFERGCCISRRKGKEVEDNQLGNGFEDCFGGLDTLPEVSGYKHPLFDYLSNGTT